MPSPPPRPRARPARRTSATPASSGWASAWRWPASASRGTGASGSPSFTRTDDGVWGWYGPPPCSSRPGTLRLSQLRRQSLKSRCRADQTLSENGVAGQVRALLACLRDAPSDDVIDPRRIESVALLQRDKEVREQLLRRAPP